jgi:signal transduction histidine kinase
MSKSLALLRLGDRYAALGLRTAAQAVFERAAAQGGSDPTAPRRLAELALDAGDGATARRHADEAQKRAPSAALRLLVARALAAAGELGAARFAFAAVMEASGVDARLRTAAYLGRAEVAAREGDAAGTGAFVSAALEELVGSRQPPTMEDAHLADEVAARAVALGHIADLKARLVELSAGDGSGRIQLILAAALAAEQAHSHGIPDAEIEGALERALAQNPGSPPIQLRLALRLSRRRYRDAQARARTIALLEELAQGDAIGEDDLERGRVYFLLAALHEDDPASRASAEDAYRKGLKLRPRHAAAANNLALLALQQGDLTAARRELRHALALDGEYDVAWLNVARLSDAARDDVAAWLDAAEPGSGALCGPVAARLARASAESATQAVLEALYSKGHRLKNLLGIAGARVRSARKAGPEDVPQRLADLEQELGALYDEWAAHLRTLQAEGPRLEIVPINPLVAEVVAAATQDGRPPLRFAAGATLPDLRGDRALLREALLNLVVNALDAQEQNGERDRPVEIATRAVVAAGRAPSIEVEIKDRGAGIARADLARIFAPGFTTKAHGSGLGLAVANRVVAAHHGRILVDSEVGRGTTITVVLPSDLGGFSTLAPTLVSRAEPQ